MTADTRGIVNADSFAKMKRGVRIVNCARGGLIVEEDLTFQGYTADGLAGIATRRNGEEVRWNARTARPVLDDTADAAPHRRAI